MRIRAADGTPGILEGDITDSQALRRQRDPQEMIDYVITHGKPHFMPGEKGAWRYSNTGYILLGLVIEKIEGRLLDKSFETRIFSPLGMNHSFLWNGIPRVDFGLPRAWLASPFTYETSEWNMSQGWAAGGVISTVDDMHIFIEGLFAGKLFTFPDTLAAMKTTVPTNLPTYSGYGIGLKQMGKDLWGHGGQTLGFLSSTGAFTDQHVSFVAWSTTSGNILALGDMLVADALHKAGVVRQQDTRVAARGRDAEVRQVRPASPSMPLQGARGVHRVGEITRWPLAVGRTSSLFRS